MKFIKNSAGSYINISHIKSFCISIIDKHGFGIYAVMSYDDDGSDGVVFLLDEKKTKEEAQFYLDELIKSKINKV